MSAQKRGPIAKAIENSCARLCLGNGTEAEFKESLKKIIQEYGVSRGSSLLNIGMALQRSAVECCKDRIGLVWGLVDDVEPKIRRAWERYEADFLGVTSGKVPGSLGSDTGRASTNRIVACWHHGDIERLNAHLRLNRIDLYGKEEVTALGTKRLDRFWNHLMRLLVEDRVQIAVKGQIVATATIAKLPEDFPQGVRPWRSVVYLKDIYCFERPIPARCHRLQSSHRFDGPRTSLLTTLS